MTHPTARPGPGRPSTTPRARWWMPVHQPRSLPPCIRSGLCFLANLPLDCVKRGRTYSVGGRGGERRGAGPARLDGALVEAGRELVVAGRGGGDGAEDGEDGEEGRDLHPERSFRVGWWSNLDCLDV